MLDWTFDAVTYYAAMLTRHRTTWSEAATTLDWLITSGGIKPEEIKEFNKSGCYWHQNFYNGEPVNWVRVTGYVVRLKNGRILEAWCFGMIDATSRWDNSPTEKEAWEFPAFYQAPKPIGLK